MTSDRDRERALPSKREVERLVRHARRPEYWSSGVMIEKSVLGLIADALETLAAAREHGKASQAMTTANGDDRERARTFWHEWIDETASEKVERVRLDALAAEFAAVREEAERRVSNHTGEPETCPECGAQYWTPGNLDIALHADKAWRKAFVEAKQREAWDAARSQTYGATFKPESRYATFEDWKRARRD